MQTSTSKNNSACRCDKNCGCCLKKQRPQQPQKQSTPGFLGRRPWIWVCVAFALMFSAWTVMFTLAMHHQPEVVPLAVSAAQ